MNRINMFASYLTWISCPYFNRQWSRLVVENWHGECIRSEISEVYILKCYLLTKDAPKNKTSEVSGLDVGWYNKKMTAKDGMTLDEAVDFLNMQFDGSIDASDLLGILTGPTREQYIDMQADRAMNAWMRVLKI